MNIVYDHRIFSWQEYGGISRYFYELAKRVGNTRTFTASIVAPFHVNRYLLGGGVDVNGVHIPKIKNSGRILSTLNDLISPVPIRLSQPDVLHETYYCKRSLAPRGCPSLVTVFDMTHEKFPEHLLSRDKTSEIKRAAVRRADHVICISENTQRDLIDIAGIPIEKTTVIHLGFTVTDQEEHVQLQVGTLPFLLYVGPRGGYKNFDALLAAYASSPILRGDFSLVAFGGGRFTSVEEEKIRALGLTGSVMQVAGDDALLTSLYKRSAAFVYPSLYEGFGIPLLEAMSCDCPVVCSNASSIPEVAGDAASYFNPADVDSIRTAIESVVVSSDVQNTLVLRGRERIGHFSWDKTANETMKIYQDLTS